MGYRANDAIIREMLGNVKRNTILHVIGRGGAMGLARYVEAWSPELKLGTVYESGCMQFVRLEFYRRYSQPLVAVLEVGGSSRIFPRRNAQHSASRARFFVGPTTRTHAAHG